MSQYLVNHPLPPFLVARVTVAGFGLALIFFLGTLIDIGKVDRTLWRVTGRSMWRWLGLALAPAAFFVVAVLVALVTLNVRVWMILLVAGAPSVIVNCAWWFVFRPRLMAEARASSATVVPPRPTAGSIARAIGSWVVMIAACAAFGSFTQAVLDWTVGDPTAVYDVGPHHATIQPRAYIDAHCPGSVRATRHLISGNVTMGGDSYQRWSVLPRPGHMDEVLLDTDSGKVICP